MRACRCLEYTPSERAPLFTCTALAPVPITATRLPWRLREWSQRAVWKAAPVKFSMPGVGGGGRVQGVCVLVGWLVKVGIMSRVTQHTPPMRCAALLTLDDGVARDGQAQQACDEEARVQRRLHARRCGWGGGSGDV